jgi:hypothetical protein
VRPSRGRRCDNSRATVRLSMETKKGRGSAPFFV